MAKKVVFCTPCMVEPLQCFQDSLAASIPLIKEAGWDEGTVYEIGCPYISHARAKMLRKALDAKADVIVFIDYDLGWEPEDLLKLIETPGDVVAGTYRFKDDESVRFMGAELRSPRGYPMGRDRDENGNLPDNAILMHSIPAGFLKITTHAVNVFMNNYPELCFGDRFNPLVDLFNHGAHDWTWYGEDYAFSRRWRECGGQIWCVPELNLTHYRKEKDGTETPFGGTFDQFLRDRGQNKLEAVETDSAA